MSDLQLGCVLGAAWMYAVLWLSARANHMKGEE